MDNLGLQQIDPGVWGKHSHGDIRGPAYRDLTPRGKPGNTGVSMDAYRLQLLPA